MLFSVPEEINAETTAEAFRSGNQGTDKKDRNAEDAEIAEKTR